ncbi:hypothetical protein [Geobacillus sp. LYN3]|nr:hypothetical protein [Geobacillus sp. LYN3]
MMFENKLADENAVKQYDEVLKSIDSLTEDEAKTVLKQIYMRLDIVKNGNKEYKSEQCVKDLISQFKDFVRIEKIKKENNKGSSPNFVI